MLNIKTIESRVIRLGWLIWAVALIAQLLNQFHRVAGSVVVEEIMADFGISATIVGSVMSTYFFIYATMQFPSGVLADYVGPRKTITYGCLVASIGSLIFGLAPSLSVLYLGRVLLSLGVAVVFVNVLKIQAQWFQSRYFGRITSLTAFIGMGGSLIGTVPMTLLVMLVGWRLSFELISFLGFIVCLACWLVIKDSPADVGLPSPNEIAPIRNTDKIGFRKGLSLILSNKHIWPPFLIGAGSYGTLLVFQGAWGIPYLTQVYSMAPDLAASFMLLTIIGFMAGTIIIGFISDSLQIRKLPAIVCSLAYLSLCLALMLWNGGKPPVPALYPICFLMGFFSGYLPLIYACTKEVVPPSVSGMSMGLVNAGIFLSAAVSQIVFGKVLDLNWQGVLIEGVRIYPQTAFQSGFVLVCFGALAYVIGALTLKETKAADVCVSS